MSYISDTLQPARFGEIYSLFNTRLDGEVKWNSTDKTLQTRGLKIFTTPITGGGQAITLIPDGLYPMTSLGSALWIKLTRYSGSATASPVAYDSSQPTPSQDWIELAYRSDTNIINLFGGSIAGTGAFSRPGTSRGGGLYDAIVGPVGNPVATHTSIQTAIDDCLDGNRILILQGTYNIASPGNAGLDANSALAWSGKTLSIEGQGYGTVIVNTGALTTAFFIRADATGKGTGSQIKNLKIQTFSKSVAFNGSLGAINDCSIDLYHSTATYTGPTIVGSGYENSVKEWVMPAYKIIESRVSNNIINVTGNITIGNTVVSNLSSLVGIAEGQTVVGSGIASNTFIVNVNVGTNQLLLNNRALANITGVSLTISSVTQSVTKENSITTITGTLKLPSLSAKDTTDNTGDALVLGNDNQLTTLGYSKSNDVNTLVQRSSTGTVVAGFFSAIASDTTSLDRVAVRGTGTFTYRWATAETISSFLSNTDMNLRDISCTSIQCSNFSSYGGFFFGDTSTDTVYSLYNQSISAQTVPVSDTGYAIGIGIRKTAFDTYQVLSPVGHPSIPRTAFLGPIYMDYCFGSDAYQVPGLASDQGALSFYVKRSDTGTLIRILSFRINMLITPPAYNVRQGDNAPVVGT